MRTVENQKKKKKKRRKTKSSTCSFLTFVKKKKKNDQIDCGMMVLSFFLSFPLFFYINVSKTTEREKKTNKNKVLPVNCNRMMTAEHDLFNCRYLQTAGGGGGRGLLSRT